MTSNEELILEGNGNDNSNNYNYRDNTKRTNDAGMKDQQNLIAFYY